MFGSSLSKLRCPSLLSHLALSQMPRKLARGPASAPAVNPTSNAAGAKGVMREICDPGVVRYERAVVATLVALVQHNTACSLMLLPRV